MKVLLLLGFFFIVNTVTTQQYVDSEYTAEEECYSPVDEQETFEEVEVEVPVAPKRTKKSKIVEEVVELAEEPVTCAQKTVRKTVPKCAQQPAQKEANKCKYSKVTVTTADTTVEEEPLEVQAPETQRNCPAPGSQCGLGAACKPSKCGQKQKAQEKTGKSVKQEKVVVEAVNKKQKKSKQQSQKDSKLKSQKK